MNNHIKPDFEYRTVYSLNDTLVHEDYELLIWSNGDREYYLNGRLHREGAPAVIRKDGYQAWFIYDNLHRVNGPAVMYSVKNFLYYINDCAYYADGFWKKIFTTNKYMKELIQFYPICEEYFGSKENVAVHLDQEIELGKLTAELQNNEIIQKRLELIIKLDHFLVKTK